MARNKLSDMNDHLFAQLERLNDEQLQGEDLNQEIDRAKAMAGIATQIVNGAKTTVDAMKLAHRGEISEEKVNKMLGFNDGKK